MTRKERSELYNKIYDEFIELIKGKVDKVVISECELYELSKAHYYEDIDYNLVRHYTYADTLKELCKNKNISQEKDLITNNYIFRLERL